MASDTQISDEHLVDAYLVARNTVIREGYGTELQWQECRDIDQLSEREFLRESAWVVLSSGMSELIIRRKFSAISAAFRWWKSAKTIIRNGQQCRNQALQVFGHQKKINAIVTIANMVCDLGFRTVQNRLAKDGVEFLRSLPYMGPATSLHLAKNIGINVAKPDRHLVRMAIAAGYENPAEMCNRLDDYVADTVPVIDIVLWRYATLSSNCTNIFAAT